VRACLTTPKETRHAVHHSVVDMIGEVLQSVENGYAAQVDALRKKISEADAEKATRVAVLEAASATKTEKHDAVVASEENLEEAKAAALTARDSAKVAVSEQKAGDSELLTADDKKARAEKVASEDLRLLVEGTSADIARSVESVAKVGKELGIEAQLLQAAELVLRTLPAKRGSFDGMVTQQVEEHFQKSIQKLTDLLASGEAGKTERASKVDGCNTIVEAADAKRAVCQEQLDIAKKALAEAELARKAAEKSVEDFGPEMENVVASVSAADAVLVACKADLATFKELVEGTPPAPESAPVEDVIATAHIPSTADAAELPAASQDEPVS